MQEIHTEDTVQDDQHDIENDGLFNLSIDMLCVAGTDGYFKRVNPAFERTLGWTTEELLSKPFFDFVHPEDRAATESALGALVRGEEVIDFENRYLHRDSSYRWFQWRAVPSGEMVYAVARDVTAAREQLEERRRLEERVLQARKLESLGLLAGGIAHDFNNLLTGILGHAELALLDLPPASPGRGEIEMIGTTAIRASELCNQMLAYAGKGRFVIKRFQLEELVLEIAELLKVSISKNVSLRFDFAADLPLVEGDVSQIRQVVMNLITNASEAIGGKNGTILVTTGVTEASRDDLEGSQFGSDLEAGRYMFCEVTDTGHGMDRETQKRIFDPFFTTKFTGRGLGLAAVLGIVRGHGGGIQVDSEQGRGTSFKILLPIPERLAAEPDDKKARRACRGHGKVLMADDDEDVREITRSLLERLGFEVLTASDGEECLEEFDRHRGEVQLVVLDLTMPRLGGEAAFRELRRRDDGIRVLMTSGYSEQDVTLLLADESLTGFLQKPYRLRDFEDKLWEIMPELRALEESAVVGTDEGLAR